MTLEFFDANVMIGRPMVPPAGTLPLPATAPELLAAMNGYGVDRALVWHVATRDAAVPVGNRLLTEVLGTGGDRLVGCWGFLPDVEGDATSGEPLFKTMLAARVRALRCWPGKNRFLLNRESCDRTLAGLQERAIPLFVPVPSANDWQMVYNLLRDYPRLPCVVTEVGLWGVDRYVRPLFEHYPNVRMELSEYLVAGGIAPLVGQYGHDRLLFGSGFPQYHAGGAMLMVRHAPIPEAAQRAIAGGTLARLLDAAQVG